LKDISWLYISVFRGDLEALVPTNMTEECHNSDRLQSEVTAVRTSNISLQLFNCQIPYLISDTKRKHSHAEHPSKDKGKVKVHPLDGGKNRMTFQNTDSNTTFFD
jgi:hypothetical protein